MTPLGPEDLNELLAEAAFNGTPENPLGLAGEFEPEAEAAAGSRKRSHSLL